MSESEDTNLISSHIKASVVVHVKSGVKLLTSRFTANKKFLITVYYVSMTKECCLMKVKYQQ